MQTTLKVKQCEGDYSNPDNGVYCNTLDAVDVNYINVNNRIYKLIHDDDVPQGYITMNIIQRRTTLKNVGDEIIIDHSFIPPDDIAASFTIIYSGYKHQTRLTQDYVSTLFRVIFDNNYISHGQYMLLIDPNNTDKLEIQILFNVPHPAIKKFDKDYSRFKIYSDIDHMCLKHDKNICKNELNKLKNVVKDRIEKEGPKLFTNYKNAIINKQRALYYISEWDKIIIKYFEYMDETKKLERDIKLLSNKWNKLNDIDEVVEVEEELEDDSLFERLFNDIDKK